MRHVKSKKQKAGCRVAGLNIVQHQILRPAEVETPAPAKKKKRVITEEQKKRYAANRKAKRLAAAIKGEPKC